MELNYHSKHDIFYFEIEKRNWMLGSMKLITIINILYQPIMRGATFLFFSFYFSILNGLG